jgi:hypothetical protein
MSFDRKTGCPTENNDLSKRLDMGLRNIYEGRLSHFCNKAFVLRNMEPT